jgi:Protein of unknown function (DUF2911)
MENTGLEAVRKSFVQQTIVAFLFLLAMIGSCQAQQDKLQQNKSKDPSPRASASCSFSDGKTVHTDYFRPGVKGRKILGALVPYAQKWSFSADSPPTFVADVDLSVGGQDVPAGTYTLSAIPNSDKWTLIISKETSNQRKGDEEDPLSVEMKVSKTSATVENFTIAYDPKDGRCTLRMSWENTQAWVEVAEKRLCWPTTSPLTYQCPDQ